MTCSRCDGTGKIAYRILGDGIERRVTEDTTVTDMGGWGTRACTCVLDLPAVDGTATWWETETVYSQVVTVPVGNEAIEVTADGEVPRGDDGRRVHRTVANMFYPPLIRVETPPSMLLHADTARELAAALTAAADACDKADRPVQLPAGGEAAT